MPRWLLIATLTLSLSACGEIVAANDAAIGGDDDGDGGGGTIDAATGPCEGTVALAELGHCIELTFCDVVTRCTGSDLGDTECRNFEIDLGGLDLRLIADALTPRIAAGQVTYHGDRVPACLAGLRASACRSVFGEGNPLDACEIFTGDAAANEPCVYGLECADPGSRCEGGVDPAGPAPACTGNVCNSPVPRGQSCANDPCNPGDHCVGAEQVCQAGDLNAPCAADNDCDIGFWCNGGSPGSATGTCTAAFDASATCVSERQCAGDLFCVGDILQQKEPAGTCQAAAASGAACDGVTAPNNREIRLTGCVDGFYCAGANGLTLGTCKPTPEEDQPCGVFHCGLFMTCADQGTAETDDDVCVTYGDLGKPCGQALRRGIAPPPPCNAGLFCSSERTGSPSGTCSAAVDDGELCRRDEHCTSGYCSCTRDATNGECADSGVCDSVPSCE